jgi:vacuolar-type H+-ATPase subunit I/STV1
MNESDLDVKLLKLTGVSDQIDEAKARLKDLNAEYDALNYDITQYMLATDCTGKKVHGKNFILTSRNFVKVEDPVAFDAWVEANDAYKLVMARNNNKLQAFCKEAIENGQAIPEGVVPGFIEQYIQIRG